MIALGLAVFSAWCGLRWSPAFIACALFLLTDVFVLFLALRPPIEIHDTHLRVDRLNIPWNQIRRLDRTAWIQPLVIYLTLLDDRRVRIIYPGDLESSNNLLRHLRRNSRESLIDGIPYRQFWGESLAAAPERKQLTSPRYQLLRPEDEAEVERLLRRLKTVGHLDPKNSSDEK